jgi:hypothetical protein
MKLFASDRGPILKRKSQAVKTGVRRKENKTRKEEDKAMRNGTRFKK